MFKDFESDRDMLNDQIHRLETDVTNIRSHTTPRPT